MSVVGTDPKAATPPRGRYSAGVMVLDTRIFNYETERHESGELQRLLRERQVLAEEYARGYLEGWEECFDAWTRAMKCDPEEWTGREN